MKLRPDMRVVCVCRKGQVRSVAARCLLFERGFRKVVACGWETNDAETVTTLCEWADAVVMVGNVQSWGTTSIFRERYPEKLVLIDVGQDVWGRYDHPDLIDILTQRFKALLA